MAENLLTRVLQTGCTPGKDIEGFTRGMLRYLDDDKEWKKFNDAKVATRRTWGAGKVTLAKRCAAKAGLPQFGMGGPNLERAMRAAKAFDASANKLMVEYATSLKPKMIEPKQGWSSLHSSLWAAYSLAMSTPGMSDLGTYNPDSMLPSGKPSDHAVKPAFAFDIGIEPDTGWNNLKARGLAQTLCALDEVEYVILGDKINTKDGRGWRAYTDGGHMNHIHVSGNR